MQQVGNVLPLPQFILQYLRKRGVQIVPDPYKQRMPQRIENKLGNSIETLVEARTYYNINKTYRWYLSETARMPVMLQQDYQQFTFPFFVHLALQLFKRQRIDEAIKFIGEYRMIQPQECQETIDALLEQRDQFDPPNFDISVTQFALDDIMRNIEAKKEALLSFIITTHIRLEIAPFNHDLLFVSVGDATGHDPTEPILAPVEFEQPPLSVKFHPDRLTQSPSILETDDRKLYLTQALPDVAHFVTFNHNNRIADMKVSQCARLLSIAMDSNVEVYRLNSTTGLTISDGKKSTTLMSHSGKVLTTAFSDDSRYVVSGGMDCQIRVAHTEAFRPMAHFKMHLEPILDVAWDHRSAFFVGASQDRSISMWSLGSPNCLRYFVGHSLPPSKVLFSKDNNSIVSCSNDLTVRIWDVGTGKQKAKFACGRSMPVAIDVHPSNSLIACGCQDGSVVLWNSVDGKYMWSELQNEFGDRITDVKFSGDGSLLLASSIEGDLVAWALDEGHERVMKTQADASTIDSITVTDRNLICTTGRSLRSGKVADEFHEK